MNGSIDSIILDIKRTQSIREIEPCVDTSKMGGKKKWKPFAFLCVLALVTSVIFYFYACPGQHCSFWSGKQPVVVHMIKPDSQASMHNIKNDSIKSNIEHPSLVSAKGNSKIDSYTLEANLSDADSDAYIERSSKLNFDEDVLVFLHIQKTGGTTFGRSLVKKLDIDFPCKCYQSRKRCDCYSGKRNIWLFSRYSTGWSCGLHADWTELKVCVPGVLDRKEQIQRQRNYYYFTILRDPVARFISEWKHVERGATWSGVTLKCNGRSRSLEQVPFCYEGDDWTGVTLYEFMNCPSNLAINRQSRMLANLSLVNCYNHTGMTESERNLVILESAKENLKNFTYFGLLEFMADTQRLFEYKFKLRFLTRFIQYSVTHTMEAKVSDEDMAKIRTVNSIDMQLYDFAKKLFFKRVHSLKGKLKTMKISSEDTGGNGYPQNHVSDYPNTEFKIGDLLLPEDDYSDDEEYDYDESDESDDDIDEGVDPRSHVSGKEIDSKIYDFNFQKTDDKTMKSEQIKQVLTDERLVDGSDS